MISIPGKIPIHIYPLFWLLIFAIGWLNSGSFMGMFIWGGVILFSILIHEYGHALTAMVFGQQAEISLVGMGGLTSRSGPSISKWKEFLIVLNGPLAGFLLFFIVSGMQSTFTDDRFPVLREMLQIAIYVNLFWNILNLLPILPLDGGHLMRIAFEAIFGFKGLKISLFISIVLAVLVSLLLFFGQALLGGVLFLMLAFESYQAWSGLKYVTQQDTQEPLQELLKEAQQDLSENRNSEALSKFLFLREQSKHGVLFILSTQYIARLLAQQGQIKQAYEWLAPIENQLEPDYLYFLQQLAYQLQEWDHAIKIGTKAYQASPSPEPAVLNALAYGVMGQVVPAVGWLQCAIESGLTTASQVIHKREFDAIRSSSEFKKMIAHYRL